MDIIDDRAALPKGSLLDNGRYSIIDKLGNAGGSAITYKANDSETFDIVAIKEFFPYGQGIKRVTDRNNERVLIPTADGKDKFVEGKDRFFKEAQKLKSITNDHVVKIHKIFYQNETAYIVMQLVGGKTLSEQVNLNGSYDRRPLPWKAVVEIAIQVAKPLAILHGKKGESVSIHQDVTPNNLMVEERQGKWHATLIDFGGVRELQRSQRVATMSFIGTEGFAAPEQRFPNSGPRGPWTDVYGLAATMECALKGNQGYPQDVPKWLRSAIAKGTAERIADRPQSIGGFLNLLRPNPADMLPPGLKSKPITLFTTSVVSLAIGFVIWPMLHSETQGPSPTPGPSLTPEPTATPSPVATPTPQPTAMPQPTATPEIKATPKPQPTSEPTPRPTFQPTPHPTPLPTPQPTPHPTPLPTPQPTPRPTPHSTPSPTPTPPPPPTPSPSPTARPTPPDGKVESYAVTAGAKGAPPEGIGRHPSPSPTPK